MPIFPGKLFLQGDNSGSFAIVESQHSRGTSFVIDDFTSASLAKIGTSPAGQGDLRALGTIVATSGSSLKSPEYYVYFNSSSGDTNLSGSEWTTLTNWKELLLDSNNITIGNLTASGSSHVISGSVKISGSVEASMGRLFTEQIESNNSLTIDVINNGNIDLRHNDGASGLKFDFNTGGTPNSVDVVASEDLKISAENNFIELNATRITMSADTEIGDNLNIGGNLTAVTMSAGNLVVSGTITSSNHIFAISMSADAFKGDGSGLTNVKAFIPDDINNLTASAGIISGTVEGDAQGQIKFNDVNVDVKDLGTDDKPTFAEVTASDFFVEADNPTFRMRESTFGLGLKIATTGLGTTEISTEGGSTGQDINFSTTADSNILQLNGGTGMVGIGCREPGEKLEVEGNISSSGTIYGDIANFNDYAGIVTTGNISASNHTGSLITAASASFVDISVDTGSFSTIKTSFISASSISKFNTTDIIVSNDISASGLSTFNEVVVQTNPQFQISMSNGNISASGIISASELSVKNIISGFTTTRMTASHGVSGSTLNAAKALFVGNFGSQPQQTFTKQISMSNGNISASGIISASELSVGNIISGFTTTRMTASHGVSGSTINAAKGMFVGNFGSDGQVNFTRQISMSNGNISASRGISTIHLTASKISDFTTTRLTASKGVSGSTLNAAKGIFVGNWGSTGQLNFTKQISMSNGNISASGIISASELSVGNIISGFTTTRMTASHGVSGSTVNAAKGLFVGNFGSRGQLNFTKQISMSNGNISASGIISASELSVGNIISGFTTTRLTASKGVSDSTLNAAKGIFVGNWGSTGQLNFTKQISMSNGNISASGNLTINNISASGISDFNTTHITASGGISASGLSTFNNISGSSGSFKYINIGSDSLIPLTGDSRKNQVLKIKGGISQSGVAYLDKIVANAPTFGTHGSLHNDLRIIVDGHISSSKRIIAAGGLSGSNLRIGNNSPANQGDIFFNRGRIRVADFPSGDSGTSYFGGQIEFFGGINSQGNHNNVTSDFKVNNVEVSTPVTFGGVGNLNIFGEASTNNEFQIRGNTTITSEQNATLLEAENTFGPHVEDILQIPAGTITGSCYPPTDDFNIWAATDLIPAAGGGTILIQIPLPWTWVYSSDFSQLIDEGRLVYSATGSLISGSNFQNSTLPIWSASAGSNLFDYTQTTDQLGVTDYVSNTFSCQLSASVGPPANFPTFPQAVSESMVDGETYKWKVTLNKMQDSTDNGNLEAVKAADQLIITSSDSFMFTPLERLPGDTNLDGNLDILDLVTMINHVLGANLLEGVALQNANLNNDGVINILDVITLINIIQGAVVSTQGSLSERLQDVSENIFFNHLQNERKILSASLSSLTTANNTGDLAQITSSLNQTTGSILNLLSSGSARRTVLRKKLNNMFVPKRELGYNFIQPRSASNELNGIVEGSTLLINNSIKSVEETFSDGTNITHVRLDNPVSSGSLSGSYFTNFKPKGFYPSEKVATRDGKNTNKGLIVRQSDNRVGIGTAKPEAILHISASNTSSGDTNLDLIKVERYDGSKFRVTKDFTEIKDSRGNVRQKGFDSKGVEFIRSGSSSTNQIQFDQTNSEKAIMTLSGSTQGSAIINLVTNTQFKQITPVQEVYRDVGGDLANAFNVTFNTASGKFSMTPSLAALSNEGIHIFQNGGVGIKTTPVGNNALTVSGSTAIGTSSLDVHRFTGSLELANQLSVGGSNISSNQIVVDGLSAIDTSLSPTRLVFGNSTTEVNILGDNGGFLHISESNVGVGTIEPTKKLQVAGDISASGDFINNGATIHSVKTFSAGDTTPDVSNGVVFLTNNSLVGTTTITGFDNGTTGQIIHVILNDNNTDFTNGTNLKLFRGLDYTSGQTNDISSFVCKDGTTWLELNRQDNS